MLMTIEGPKNGTLRPISSALSPQDFARISQKAVEISNALDARNGIFGAEIIEGKTPHWHVLITMPAHEKIALAHLVDRGFGVYLPEAEVTYVRRGRKVTTQRLLLPGYLFVFVWDIGYHLDRLRACTGVYDALYVNGHPAIIPDAEINIVRKAENGHRPLAGLVTECKAVKQPKKRWRQSKKAARSMEAQDNDIIGVHSYSPFIEALRQDTEAERLDMFHKAIGLVR